MKRIYFTIIAFFAALAVNAQTIKVYEYDGNGNLKNVPAYTSSKKVKVVFTENEQNNNADVHEWVDLGLPSGTLWAKTNVGATNETEYGLYFAWGDTKGYTSDTNDGHLFNWSTAAFNDGNSDYSETAWNKYNNTVLDSENRLKSDYDAATANWGSDWCMPTLEQFKELYNNTKSASTTIDGVFGFKFVNKNDASKYIFIPAAGKRDESFCKLAGFYAFFWLRDLYITTYTKDSSRACSFYWIYNIVYPYDDGDYRYNGFSVRAVRTTK